MNNKITFDFKVPKAHHYEMHKNINLKTINTLINNPRHEKLTKPIKQLNLLQSN